MGSNSTATDDAGDNGNEWGTVLWIVIAMVGLYAIAFSVVAYKRKQQQADAKADVHEQHERAKAYARSRTPSRGDDVEMEVKAAPQGSDNLVTPLSSDATRTSPLLRPSPKRTPTSTSKPPAEVPLGHVSQHGDDV